MKERVMHYEGILNQNERLVSELDSLLQKLKANLEDYQALMKYYGSPEYFDDLHLSESTDELKGIPHGVLSEDGVYNLITSMHTLHIEMLEIATAYLK